jgi:hypothetical protein
MVHKSGWDVGHLFAPSGSRSRGMNLLGIEPEGNAALVERTHAPVESRCIGLGIDDQCRRAG